MDSRVVSDSIGRMAWIDPVADLLQGTVSKAYRAMGKTGERIERVLHGEFLGHPLHPVTVHLPIGAWTLAALLDPWGGSLAARMGADLAVAVGVIAALFSAVTGATDYYPYGDASVRRIGGLHAMLNWAAIVLYALSWWGRAEGARDLARFLSYVGFVNLAFSGYLGGLLVYEKRIGANHAPIVEDETAPDGWTAVAKLADLQEAKPTRANAGDVPLVLVRQGETVHAMAWACSHQGGPLDEGQVENGCLSCPWHQTAFRLTDGEPVSGPGVFPQPVYPIRIVNGNVEVNANDPVFPTSPAGRATMR